MFKNICFISFFLFVSCVKSEESSLSFGGKFTMGIVAEAEFKDKGFLQGAFEGTVKVRDEFGINLITKILTPYPVKGKELMTKEEAALEDIYSLQKEGANFIWLIGSLYSGNLLRLSYENPNVFYGIVDPIDYGSLGIKVPRNGLGIKFRHQEGAFLAGYVAAKMSRRGKVGFLSLPFLEYLEDFLVGFQAGALYANPRVRVFVKRLFASGFYDKSSGKFAAKHMYVNDGVDVIFPVAGIASLGVFEAAKELGPGRYAIGVDRDQAYLAPENIITSVIKDVGKAIYDLSVDAIKNKNFRGGRIVEQGLKEGVIDIVKDPSIIGDKLVEDLFKLQNDIIERELIVPATKYEFDLFKSNL
ncbi:BMP family protein [Borrelia sp. BU AG58]|uniref:BMP family ABC transporter substrate-binding protein n=1 Tax=Borrelia sp. BU AG58 TaxID=2887345 RepID=UPI001E62BE84|nr:BMP family protein [Borrelia sp. BU AG58]UER67560.1 BMP family protein [Borrelia sp. BU AG58]